MRVLLRSIHRIATHPWLNLAAGALVLVLVVVQGILDEEELKAFDGNEAFGVLGLVLLLRSLAALFVGARRVEEVYAQLRPTVRHDSLARRVLAHPLVALAIAVLVLYGGLMEVVADLADEQLDSWYHAGLLLVGVNIAARALHALMDAGDVVVASAARTQWRLEMLVRLNAWLRKPGPELLMASSLLILGFIEHHWLSRHGSLEAGAMAIAALPRFLAAGPAFLEGLRLLDEAVVAEGMHVDATGEAEGALAGSAPQQRAGRGADGRSGA